MAERQPPILHLDRVSLTQGRGGSPLLQDISLTLWPGERVAILGPSGAGKTTLLRLLNRLGEPTGGTIEFAGQPLHSLDVRQLRQQVALVPQEPKLLGMAVGETLTYPLRLQQLADREIRQRLETWLGRLAIPESWLERREWQLSLGQRQLVTLARALATEPPVLLLDEPTSALDAGTALRLVKVLEQWAGQSRATVLMVNHQLEIAQQFAQRVLYLEGGQLAADLPAAQSDWDEIREALLQVASQDSLDAEF